MDPRFPPIEPFDSGLLEVGQGHRVYWETVGAPDGLPALYLHGGPGGGASPGQRRFFDPTRYRAVLFDQRGCGRSRPLAEEPGADLSANTTPHLLADIELLRERLGVDRWVVLGLSWGTTLALAYAERHPERVAGLVLGLVTTTSRREVEWITEGVGRIFPREWERFAAGVPERRRDRPLVDAYAELLFDPDPAVCAKAARDWCDWEDAHVSLVPGFEPNPRFQDADFRLRFARLVTHYWRHHAFLGEEELLRNAHRLDGIPGVMIHGRYDVSGPLETAWRLSKAWTSSRLVVLDDAGHGSGDSFPRSLIEALAQFA
jgi:proline iminopeptidase